MVTALLGAACGSSASDGADTTEPAGGGTASGPAPVETTAPVGTDPATTSTSSAMTATTPIMAPPTTADPAAGLEARPLPASPAEVAAELTEVELALGQPGIDEVSARPWGRRQQLLYRVLSAHPDWADQVVAGVDPAVAEVVALNWEARRNLSSLVRSESIASTLPAWSIEPPLPAEELIGYYKEAAAATGVPWTVLAAINLVETRMGRINGLSTAGAVGPMQFLPSTWAECCTGDPTVDRDAIIGAAEYLIDRGAERNLERAVFGYNNSDNYVRAVLAHAAVLDRDERRYYGYHAWEVVFLSTAGLVRLPEGYRQEAPVDAAGWVAANPGSLVDGAT